MDPDAWFPNDPTNKTGKAMVDAAIAECRECPVLRRCREWTEIIRPIHGVWAGKLWEAI